MNRPIRFGLIAAGATPHDLIETAKTAEVKRLFEHRAQ